MAGVRARFALVGVGRWGENHLRLLADRSARGDLELVCAVDTSPLARERAAAICPGLRVVSELGEALDRGVDALVIATPPETHAELGRRALEAGKHLLVEKPLSICAADARELAELAERRGLALGTGHLVLHHGAYEALFERATSDPALAVQAEREGAIRGPIDPLEVLWSLAPHDLAVACSLLGGGLRVSRARPLDRGAHVELVSPSGAHATLRVERVARPELRRATVTTARGRYQVDELAGTLHFAGASRGGPIDRVTLDHAAAPLDRQLDAFLTELRGGSPRRRLGDPGPAVVELLEQAARALSAWGDLNAAAAPGNEALPMAAAAQPG